MEAATTVCPSCALPVLAEFYFCPNCGKQLRAKKVPISIGQQVGLYLLSALLPPLGLWPGIKYLRKEDNKSKMVGLVAIILTILSLVISTALLGNVINQSMQQIGTLNTGF
jgi:hypothetical protein